MERKDGCCRSGDTATVLACSGGSNVGQVTNEVAKLLDSEGLARLFCLAGVGGHIAGMVTSVDGADKVLVLDGCPVACGKAVMDAAGLKSYEWLVVTDLGIEKKHDFALNAADVDCVLDESRSRLNGGS